MWIKVTDYLSNVDNNNKKVLVNTNNVDRIFPARSIGYDGKTAISFCRGKENCIVVNESIKEIEAMISDGKNSDKQPEKIMHWEQKVIHSEFKREQLEETVIYICDRCGQRSEKETNFCPNCGAKADWFYENERKING